MSKLRCLMLPECFGEKYDADVICKISHIAPMKWAVIFHDDFDPEFEGLPEAVQYSLLAHAALLQTLGPNLGRPRVDTLNGSKHANMKEL